MKDVTKTIKHYIMSLTYGKRREKKLGEYRKQLVLLRQMDYDELTFEYISLKAKYEHKIMILIFIAVIGAKMLIDAYKTFFSFMQDVFKYVDGFDINESEVVAVALLLVLIIMLFVSIAISTVVFLNMQEAYDLRKKLLLAEEMKRVQPNA